jgi:hypothetical protein
VTITLSGIASTNLLGVPNLYYGELVSISSGAAASGGATGVSFRAALPGSISAASAAGRLLEGPTANSAFATGVAGGLTKRLRGSISTASATSSAQAPTTIASTTIYNVEGFDHQAGQADLLFGPVSALVNATVFLSNVTPFNVGKSLRVRVIGDSSSASDGYAVCSPGPFNLTVASLGVMMRSTAATNACSYVGFCYGTIPHVYCSFSGTTLNIYSGPMTALGGGTLLQTIFNAVPATEFFFFELQISVSTTASGFVAVRVNETEIGLISNVVTSGTGSTIITGVLLGGHSPVNTTSDFRFDDLYIASNFVGHRRVVTLHPTANGTTTQFQTSSVASNWQEVSATAFDGDAGYNFSNTYAALDKFAQEALPVSTTGIDAVKVTSVARRDAADVIKIANVVASGAASLTGASTALTSDYQYISTLLTADPATGVGWTTSAVNAAQIGYTVTATVQGLIYNSIDNTTVAAFHGLNDSMAILANSFALPLGFPSPTLLSLGLGAIGGGLGTSINVYLAPDLGPSGTVPNGPNLAAKQLIGSTVDNNLSTTGTPRIITLSLNPTTVASVLAATVANQFWVVIDMNGSNGVWFTNDGTVNGYGADGQAHYTGSVVLNTPGNGPFLMAVFAT